MRGVWQSIHSASKLQIYNSEEFTMIKTKTNLEKLEDAKKRIEALGYDVEMGATHLDVTLPTSNDLDEDDIAKLEASLKKEFGVDVWVMEEEIILLEDEA
jgi:hypothetical protein